MCMGLTRYQKTIKILKKYMDDSKRDCIYTNDLKGLIRREIGSDIERVLVPTLQMLRDEGIIHEVKVNKWEIKLK